MSIEGCRKGLGIAHSPYLRPMSAACTSDATITVQFDPRWPGATICPILNVVIVPPLSNLPKFVSYVSSGKAPIRPHSLTEEAASS